MKAKYILLAAGKSVFLIKRYSFGLNIEVAKYIIHRYPRE